MKIALLVLSLAVGVSASQASREKFMKKATYFGSGEYDRNDHGDAKIAVPSNTIYLMKMAAVLIVVSLVIIAIVCSIMYFVRKATQIH